MSVLPVIGLVLVALLAIAYIVRLAYVMPHYGTDFDQVRFAGKLVLQGENPYTTIGQHRKYVWTNGFHYPMQAVVIGLPTALLSLVPGRALWVGVTSGTLAFVLTRRAWWPLLALLSAPWFFAVAFAQWSPIVLAAWFVPALGFVLAAKPNIGLAVYLASKNLSAFRTRTVACVLITVLAFVLMPSWLGEWLHSIGDADYVQQLVRVRGGAFVLLVLLRWRRPEARFLAALSMIPHDPQLYEGLLLFAVPATAIQAATLAVCSWGFDPIVAAAGLRETAAERSLIHAYAILITMYLPAVVLVLRRPNVWPTGSE